MRADCLNRASCVSLAFSSTKMVLNLFSRTIVIESNTSEPGLPGQMAGRPHPQAGRAMATVWLEGCVFSPCLGATRRSPRQASLVDVDGTVHARAGAGGETGADENHTGGSQLTLDPEESASELYRPHCRTTVSRPGVSSTTRSAAPSTAYRSKPSFAPRADGPEQAHERKKEDPGGCGGRAVPEDGPGR